MIPNTFTQRGVPAVDLPPGPTPESSPGSGKGGGSAMRVASFGGASR